MTDLAPHLTDFLHGHLPDERGFSHHTIESYKDCFRLFVPYLGKQARVRPIALKIEHITIPRIAAFLNVLEQERGNSVATRNQRLAAIKGFFRYLEYREPACLDLALQVRAIVQKRADKPLIDWLDETEMQAILDAPDIGTVKGLRDRAMLHLCYAAGLRVSELTGLTLDHFTNPQLARIRIRGKGRRERELPLWKETRTVLREWLAVRPPVNHRCLFPNARGRPMSTEGFAYLLRQHVATAEQTVPSIASKRVTPHTLRHACAMSVLRSTGDTRKVSLWLGHSDVKTTEVYLRATPAEKLKILEENTPPDIRPGTFYGAQDALMAVLGGK